jgi:hypothetical protein
VTVVSLSRPWMRHLSNAELLDAFEAALDAREARDDAPDLMVRLDLLHEEILRRERNGSLTDDDWFPDDLIVVKQ